MEGAGPKRLPLKLVTIAEFHNQAEFLLARTRLESAGIECFAAERDLLQFGWRSHAGGIRLQVRESDVAEALDIVHGKRARPPVMRPAQLLGNESDHGESMRNFILGIVVAVLVLLLGGLGVALLGFVPTRADATASEMELHLAMSALDNSVDRHAPRVNNPMPPTDENLIAGVKIYTMNCAGCHGGIDRKPVELGRSFYPPAPNLILHPLDDEEWHVFYVIRTGVRYTGMPTWDKTLSEADMWKLTALLTRIEKLAPAVQEYWKNAGGASAPAGGQAEHDHK